MSTLWHMLNPGTVFRFDSKLYLRVVGNVVSLEDFMPVALHNDVKVETAGFIAVKSDVTGCYGEVVFNKSETSLEELLDRCQRIVNADISWETKYDLIFSKEIYHVVSACRRFKWVDPDMDYEDDIRAFVSAFQEYVEEQARIRKEVGDHD